MTWRWVNLERDRYYLAVVTADLFGGWRLTRYWGSLRSSRGGAMSRHCSDWQAIEKEIWRIAARRRQRDYFVVD